MKTAMNNNKLTSKDALNAVKAFAYQSEKNVAFGVLADTDNGEVSTFIKGEEKDILALLVIQMSKDNDCKRLLFKAVTIYKLAPVEKLIEKYEQDS